MLPSRPTRYVTTHTAAVAMNATIWFSVSADTQPPIDRYAADNSSAAK